MADEDTDETSGVIQFVGDNIDLNMVSIYGNTPFHSMGLIKISNAALRGNGVKEEQILRMKFNALDKAKILKTAEVPIEPFTNRKQIGINNMTFVPFADLASSLTQDQSQLSPGDTLWAAGWLIKALNCEFQHSNYNGWMKKIHANESKQVTRVDFLPVIEGDPNDYETIFTTLKECMRLCAGKVVIVNFDLPIWLKVVDIIKQRNLPIIPRLGGFHLLKSYLASVGNIMEDSGLLELIQVIYPGNTTAEHIMNGGCYDKAIRAHLLIDAAIYQHVMKHEFTEEELGDMRVFMQEVADKKMGSTKTGPIVDIFGQRFKDTFKRLAEGGRTPALWVQYHYMVDVIKIFIRTERLADHNAHLSCIVNRMLDIFAAAGHHQYAKGARLYCQLMKELETLPTYKEIFSGFTVHRNHVVRYSSHEWSGIWSDLCIEQTLMKAAKSEGGLSRGRMKNSNSGHKCWVQTLNHFSKVNQLMEADVEQHKPLHKELAETRVKRDVEAIALALKWFAEHNPFDDKRDKKLLVSFSTGYTSNADDTVNVDRAIDIGRKMQMKLDGKSVTHTMEVKFKAQTLSSLRNIPKINEKKTHLNSIKLFNRLVIFAQRGMTIETSLRYELTPFPLSLFSSKNDKMNKANKADFSNTSLKILTNPLDLMDQQFCTLVVDGGWLLYMVKWERGQTWQEIANSYLTYVQYLGSHSQKIIVVFDGYGKSPKDHDHIRRTKVSCCNLQTRPDMMHSIPKAKFMDNNHNKTQLIQLLSSTFQKCAITVEQCDNDADTSIVRQALAATAIGSVEVRAEDADVLIMLVHHQSSTSHPIFFTTSKGSYDVTKIKEALPERKRRYLLFCHAFSGCDTVSAIAGHGKTTLFNKLCAGDIDQHMNIFLDTDSNKDAVISAGVAIFQYIYRAHGSRLGTIRYNMFSTKAAAGVIRPENLPPTEGAAAQHALRAYLQTRDWILLKSMSLDPKEYGWMVGIHGYEPVPTLDPMAPDELLQFTSCNCNGDCSTRRCSCNKNGVKCISAFGICKGIICKNCIEEDTEYAEDYDVDS